MLHNILSLFGKAPSAPLKEHLALVSECVLRIPKLLRASETQDKEALFTLKEEIQLYEEQAEKLKSILRSNLLSSLSLAIDKSVLLEIVVLQDKLANAAKDIAFLFTVRPFLLDPSLIPILHQVVEKNMEAFDQTKTLLLEMPLLIEASFSGLEAEKAVLLIEQIAMKEREADLLQLKLLQALLAIDLQLTPGQFHIYNCIFQCIGSISNISERIALALRATIEL
jgi:predicted phosphate transport protein (TIGR00153 family)